MSFLNLEYFSLLFVLVVLVFVGVKIKGYKRFFSDEMLEKIVVGKNTKNINLALLVACFVLIIIALARPVIKNKPILVPQESLSIVVAFDISKSMLCADVYPNRLDFAKKKFVNLLDNLSDEKIGILGFSSRAFMISPISGDFESLKYLAQNINLGYISAKGSDILQALYSTNKLLKQNKQKALLIFTDGTDNNNFDKEIKYAKEHKIKVFIYAIGSKKGGVIQTKSGVQKDRNGDIVITRLNEDIKSLAFDSGGAYLEYSFFKNDIKEFAKAIRAKFKANKQKDILINNNQELFFAPLLLAFLLFIISLGGFRR